MPILYSPDACPNEVPSLFGITRTYNLPSLLPDCGLESAGKFCGFTFPTGIAFVGSPPLGSQKPPTELSNLLHWMGISPDPVISFLFAFSALKHVLSLISSNVSSIFIALTPQPELHSRMYS